MVIFENCNGFFTSPQISGLTNLHLSATKKPTLDKSDNGISQPCYIWNNDDGEKSFKFIQVEQV